MSVYTQKDIDSAAGEQFISRLNHWIERYIRDDIEPLEFVNRVYKEYDHFDGIGSHE